MNHRDINMISLNHKTDMNADIVLPKDHAVVLGGKGNNRNEINGNIRTIISPLIFSLKLVGLYHYRNPGTSGATSKVYKIYSALIVCVLWLNFVRTFFTYNANEAFDIGIMDKLMFQIYYFICAASSTFCYVICIPGNGWSVFFKNWAHTAKCLQKTQFQTYLRNRVSIYMGATWILIFTNMAFALYAIITTSIMDITISPIPATYPYHFQILCAGMVVQFYTVCSWIFPTSVVFFLSLAIYAEFKHFYQDLRKVVSESGELLGDLEEFRMRHQQICRLTGVVDDMTYRYNGVIGGFSMVLSMLVLSLIFWNPQVRSDPVLLTLSSVWLGGALLSMALIFLGGGIVNTMAHAPLDVVRDIWIREFSRDQKISITLFLNRLTSGPIGLTAYRMFVIDKPSILSILGVFMTYFIILVQFHQSGPPTGKQNVIGPTISSSMILSLRNTTGI